MAQVMLNVKGVAVTVINRTHHDFSLLSYAGVKILVPKDAAGALVPTFTGIPLSDTDIVDLMRWESRLELPEPVINTILVVPEHAAAHAPKNRSDIFFVNADLASTGEHECTGLFTYATTPLFVADADTIDKVQRDALKHAVDVAWIYDAHRVQATGPARVSVAKEIKMADGATLITSAVICPSEYATGNVKHLRFVPPSAGDS